MKLYWTYIVDTTEIYDAEFTSEQEAIEHAEDVFAGQCKDEEQGGLMTKDIDLIEFYWTDDGERFVTRTVKSCVEWDGDELSDFEEHFNQRDYI